MIPEHAAQLLHQFLVNELGEPNVRVQSRNDKVSILVSKPAGQKSVQGTFVIRSNDSIQAEGQTLVVMNRGKVNKGNPSALGDLC
jgi:serine/threonine-protein kinase Chk1